MSPFKFLPLVSAIALAAPTLSFAQQIEFSSQPFSYSQSFEGLGSADLTWNDGVSIDGWYMAADLDGYSGDGGASDGVPGTVYGRTSIGTTAAAYHVNDANNDQALVWNKGSATGQVYIGAQFQNTGSDANIGATVSFVLEQWAATNGATGTMFLDYKVSSTGGSILKSPSWINIDSGSVPDTTSNGSIDGLLPANQLTLSGSIANVAVNENQFLTFRIRSSMDNGIAIGVGSADISIIPEPSQAGLISAVTMLFAVALLRRR